MNLFEGMGVKFVIGIIGDLLLVGKKN